MFFDEQAREQKVAFLLVGMFQKVMTHRDCCQALPNLYSSVIRFAERREQTVMARKK